VHLQVGMKATIFCMKKFNNWQYRILRCCLYKAMRLCLMTFIGNIQKVAKLTKRQLTYNYTIHIHK